MDINNMITHILGKKHGYCEGCYRLTELQRIKVSNYAGQPSYKYLCKACASMERFKKY